MGALRPLLAATFTSLARAWTSSAKTNTELIDNLQRDQRLSAAAAVGMRRIDRANFLPSKLRDLAYEDRPLPIGHDVTISAPHMHAAAIELLLPQLRPGASVLDVGVGSGYLAAAFAELVGPEGRVVGIDRVPALVQLARENIERHDAELLRSRVSLALADGWEASLVAAEGPYDAIHVGAAATSLPQELVSQLKPNGRMIIPVGPEGGVQELVQVDVDAEGNARAEALMSVRYVPLVKGLSGQEEAGEL